MQIRNFTLAITVLFSGPAFSQVSETYLLSVPITLGENLSHEICSRALDIPNSFCHIGTMAVPGNNETLTITYHSTAGSFEEIFADPVVDFVPWPWSSFPVGPEDLDFRQNPTIPVISNPCFITTCGPGFMCEWNPETPLVGARCVNESAPTTQFALPSFGGLFMTGTLKRLETQTIFSNSNAPTPTPTDDSICGPRIPGQTCMGTHILLDNGQIMQIP